MLSHIFIWLWGRAFQLEIINIMEFCAAVKKNEKVICELLGKTTEVHLKSKMQVTEQ